MMMRSLGTSQSGSKRVFVITFRRRTTVTLKVRKQTGSSAPVETMTSESSRLFMYSSRFRKRSFGRCREGVVAQLNPLMVLANGFVVVSSSQTQRWDEVQIQWPCVYEGLPRHYKTQVNNLWSRSTLRQFLPSLIPPSESHAFDFCQQMTELARKLQSTTECVMRAPGELGAGDCFLEGK